MRLRRSTAKGRGARGQATVEMAVTMLVLLPIILYALFLEDLLVYQLDWQETVVTPAWDGLPYNYTTKTRLKEDVQHYSRLTYCDHTAAYDAFDQSFDCGNIAHHKALTAHQCWIIPGGEQVTCSVDPSVGANVDDRHASFTKGGLFECTSKLGVMNYFLVNKIFGWESEAELTDRGKYDDVGDVHGDAASGHPENHWILGEANPDHFGVLHDSWALTSLASISPTAPPPTGNPLYDRTLPYFGDMGTGTGALAKTAAFGAKLVSDELLSPSAITGDDENGDDPLTPGMAYTSDDPTRAFSGGPSGGDNYASGYSDEREADTYDSSDRHDSYFAMDPESW